MAMQEVEYEFPDPEKKEKGSIEIDIEAPADEGTDIEVEGAVGRETIEKPKKQKEPEEGTIQAGDLEIEVEDDTPVKDRGRKKSDPPEEVTDEELENYSEKVKKRI